MISLTPMIFAIFTLLGLIAIDDLLPALRQSL